MRQKHETGIVRPNKNVTCVTPKDLTSLFAVIIIITI